MKRKGKVAKGSGNVFADVGLRNPEEYLVKAELARQIINAIAASGLTQVEAAKLLGVGQPKVSALRNGHLGGFSAERLFRFLNALGRDVRIVVSRKRRRQRRGGLSVVEAA